MQSQKWSENNQQINSDAMIEFPLMPCINWNAIVLLNLQVLASNWCNIFQHAKYMYFKGAYNEYYCNACTFFYLNFTSASFAWGYLLTSIFILHSVQLLWFLCSLSQSILRALQCVSQRKAQLASAEVC